jgi:hypothetical protein
MGSADRALGVIGVAVGTWLGASVGFATDVEVAHGPFTVDQVVLEGLAGSLEVRVVAGTETRLVVEGPEEAVAALAIAADGGMLRVTVPPGGRSVTVVERMTVVTGPGASSNVVIGGSSISTSRASSSSAAVPLDMGPLDMVLEAPAGTGLTLLGFTGEAEIGDLLGPLAVQAVGGTVRVGQVTAAELAAVGGGQIEVVSVEGDLVADVTGDGRIAVLGGSIGAARVAVTGAGVVDIEAPVQSAAVKLVGGGEVRLASVAEPPQVSRIGGGQFTVGEP